MRACVRVCACVCAYALLLFTVIAYIIFLPVLAHTETFSCQIYTHRALVGFLPGVDPHVDQELVACVERLVFARTPSPEAGEVLALALVDVDLLKVLDQLLSLAVNSATVQPAAAVSSADVLLLVLLQHRRKDPEVVWDRSVMSSQVKSSHLYLYSAFNNTNCNKALHNIKIGKFVNNVK